MRFLTRYLSEEEKIVVLKQIIQGGFKGSVHDTIQLPLPLKGTDLTAMPDRLDGMSVPKWPITPFREIYGKLLHKGYNDLEFHTRVTPFPVDPRTDDRDYLIGPATADTSTTETDETSFSALSECEIIGLRKLSYQTKLSGDDVPEGYTKTPPSQQKMWDVLYIPEITNDMRQIGDKPSPVLARGLTREGMLQIFKRSEAFYVLNKDDEEVQGLSLKALEEKTISSTSASSKKQRKSSRQKKETDEDYNKNFFQNLNDLAARAKEGQKLTASELRLLYNNGYVFIPANTTDISMESVNILISKLMSENEICDYDLRTLYDHGFLGIISEKDATSSQTKNLLAKAKNEKELTDEEVRHLYEKGFLGLLSKAEKLIDCHMKIWYRETLNSTELTDEELVYLYNEGILEIRLNEWKLDKPDKKSAFIESLSNVDVHILCESGLRTVPESVAERFLNIMMTALGRNIRRNKKAAEDLIRRIYFKGFVSTPPKLLQKLLHDGFKGCDPDGKRLSLGDLMPPEQGKALPPLTHESQLCALTHAIMTSKHFTGRNVFIGEGQSQDGIVKQFDVGRTRYFRGPPSGQSGGSGLGTAKKKFKRAKKEPSTVAFKRSKTPPKVPWDKKKRAAEYCVACFMNYKSSSEKKPAGPVDQNGVSSDKKRDMSHAIHTHEPEKPTSINIVLSDNAEGMVSEQPVISPTEWPKQMKNPLLNGRTTEAQVHPAAFEPKEKAPKTRTIGDLVPNENWQVEKSSSDKADDLVMMMSTVSKKDKIKEFYSCKANQINEDQVSYAVTKKYSPKAGFGEIPNYASSITDASAALDSSSLSPMTKGTDLRTLGLMQGPGAKGKAVQRDGSVFETTLVDSCLQGKPIKIVKQGTKLNVDDGRGSDATSTSIVRDSIVIDSNIDEDAIISLAMKKLREKKAVDDVCSKTGLLTRQASGVPLQHSDAVKLGRDANRLASSQPEASGVKEQEAEALKLELEHPMSQQLEAVIQRAAKQVAVGKLDASQVSAMIQQAADNVTAGQLDASQLAAIIQKAAKLMVENQMDKNVMSTASSFDARVFTTSSERKLKANTGITHERKLELDKGMMAIKETSKDATASKRTNKTTKPRGVEIVGNKTCPPKEGKDMKKAQALPKTKKKKAAGSKLPIPLKVQKKEITDRLSTMPPERTNTAKSQRPDDICDLDIAELESPEETEMTQMLKDAGVLMDDMIEEALKLGDKCEEDEDSGRSLSRSMSFKAEEDAKAKEDVRQKASDQKTSEEAKIADMRRRVSSLLGEDFLLPLGRPAGFGLGKSFYGKSFGQNGTTRSGVSFDPYEDHQEVMKQIRESIDEAQAQKKTYMSILQTDAETAPWFEFPVNLDVLNDMHPRTYMKRYCVINPRRQPVYNRVFYRFSEKKDKLMTKPKLLRGINELLIGNYTPSQLERLLQLLQCADMKKFDKDIFLSIACLAERLADKDLGYEFPPPRNYLAELDEVVVLAHLEKLEVNGALHRLLRAIIDN